MVTIAIHILFGLTLLVAMSADVQAPEHPQDQSQVEQSNEKD